MHKGIRRLIPTPPPTTSQYWLLFKPSPFPLDLQLFTEDDFKILFGQSWRDVDKAK